MGLFYTGTPLDPHGGMEGWVDLGGWLYIEINVKKTVKFITTL